MVAGVVVVIHVLCVFWLLAGVLGRAATTARARRSNDIGEVRTLMGLSSVFETRMVRPSTGFVLLFGLLAAWLHGWPILGALQGAHTNWVLASLLIYLSIIPVIVFVFVPRGKVFRAVLEEAVERRQVTPALRAAMNDPAVAAAHVYEMGMILAITVLMVMRPF